MNRLLILFLVMVLSAFAEAQDLTPPSEEPTGPNQLDREYESLREAQRSLRQDYEALLRRMRISAANEDERANERLKKAVALMDKLAIGHEMKKLADLIESHALNTAISKARWISEKIALVLAVLDGLEPDWEPDTRIPTLEEQLEQLKLLEKMQGELQEETKRLSEKLELTEADKMKLEQLKDRQREIQDKAHELGETLPDEIKPLMNEAQDLMDQAFDQLQQENPKGAENRQGEAKDRLDEARREIEDQLRKYRERQSEKLFIHIEQELERIRTQQVAVNKLTIETHLKSEGGERVSRRDWRSISSKQRKNSKEAEILAEKLLHGNVPIFGLVMESVGRDMKKVAKLLRSKDGGEFPQEIQKDILMQLDDLLDALRNERSRRQDEGGDLAQQTNPDGSNPEPRLVPLPAELGILLKRQEYLHQKHKRFMERFPEVKDRANMTDGQRRIYERLSQKQGENASYLDSLLDTLFKRR